MRIRRILYSSHFIRALKYLHPKFKKLIEERTEIFKQNCFDQRLKTHKLKGKCKGFWSFSLTHSHRVLFEFLDDETAAFIDIGDHSIYQ